MTDQAPESSSFSLPRRLKRLGSVLSLGLLAAGAMTAGWPAVAQDGVLIGGRLIELPTPVEIILAAGPGLILATSEDAGEAMLVDARQGRLVDETKVEGRLRAAAAFVPQDDQQVQKSRSAQEDVPATIAMLVETMPGRLILRRLIADGSRGLLPSDRTDVQVPMSMEDPAVTFLPFGRGGYQGGTALVVWDRALRGGGEYLFVWDMKTQTVGMKDYPGEMVPIGSSDWMLGLHWETSRVSVIEVLSGSRDDNVFVETLRADRPGTVDIFAPSALYGGNGSALVADASTGQLLALSVREGIPPLLNPPIQVALDGLPTDRAGRFAPWVVSDRALSLILAGASGTDQAQIMRRIRGGIATIGTISLGLPVADAIALHGPATTGPEFFAFLVEGGGAISAVPASAFEPHEAPVVAGSGVEPAPGTAPVVLNPGDIAQIQRVLAAFGYPVGAIDGVTGPRTAAALRAFQFDNGLDASGQLDSQTLERLNAALSDTGKRATHDSAVRAYSEFLTKVVGAGGLASRVMTLGVSQEIPDHPCFGLNDFPPEPLWPNSVKFVVLLQRLEQRLGTDVQVVNGYQTPAYNRCIDGERRSGHQRFAAFDIRLALSGTFSESNRRLLAALEDLAQAGLATFEVEPMEASIHVEPLLGQWQAVIASYSTDERGCGFAREDVDQFAELLSGSEVAGREILVARTQTSNHYAVSVDLNTDVAAARAASALIRKVSALSRDRRTGSDSYVQQNRDWFLDQDCAHVRVIR